MEEGAPHVAPSRGPRTLAALPCALWLAAATTAQQPDDAAFADGLDGVHGVMAEGRWHDARQQLLALLDGHEERDYVLAQRDALVHDYTTCRFQVQAEVRPIGELIGGRIERYSEETRHIEVVYDGGFGDWEERDGMFVHPLVFAGSYTVRVEGPKYGADGLTAALLFDVDPSGRDWFAADFGVDHGARGQPAVVRHGDGEYEAPIGATQSTVKLDEPYVLELRVGEDTVELRSGGRRLLRCDRQPARLGRVAMRKHMSPKVTLSGRIEPSWLQARMDEELSKQRAEFVADFDAKAELPDWLFSMPAPPKTSAQEDGLVPGDAAHFSDEVDEVIALWQQGEVFRAWDILREVAAEDAPVETLTYLEVALLLAAGRVARALPVADRLLTEAPGSGLARLLHAQVLLADGRVGDAIDGMRAALALDPGNRRHYQALAIALLRRDDPGDREAAMKVLRAGKTEHGLYGELAGLDRMLAMAERGPTFAKRFSATSAHYEVVSDIDVRVCKQACKLLERSYEQLQARFDVPAEERPRPFRVYLFAGQRGYDDYCRSILGDAVPHTAGLYAPALKQLLIWNLPKRADMERTIVHEGFHQYLDRVMRDPPAWFNEGLAVYWQTLRATDAGARSSRGKAGGVQREHIVTLSRATKGLPGLKNLVYGDRADFYEHAHLRYPHAWALVHFLLEGDADNRERFDTLWQALRGQGGARAALDRAFAGVDWVEFETAMWDHLRELGSEGGRR